MKLWRFAAMFVLAGLSGAAVYRVPEDFPTIQAAFYAIEPGDSVVAYTMTHTEALNAPPFEFWLLGDVLPGDTGEYERPVIDPSSLPGSDSLACMLIPEQSKPHIEDIKFVNGAVMYPRFNNRRGGIVYWTSDTITVTRCTFDSVAGGVDYDTVTANAFVRLSQCTFRNVRYACAYGRNGLFAHDCIVEGNTWGGMVGRVWTVIERCQFRGQIELVWIGLYRDGGIVNDCIFGPGYVTTNSPIDVYSWGSVVVENCLFHELELHAQLGVITLRETGSTVFSNNTFLHNFSTPHTIAPISIYDDGTLTDVAGSTEIRDNIFSGNETAPDGSNGVKLINVWSELGDIEISGNRFYDNLPQSSPVIEIDTSGDRVRVFRNLFQNNRYALQNDRGQLDARWNYWGNASGPYHDELNPDGQGDEVSGNVLFDPWYPDSSFLDTPLRTKPSVLRHQLRAYPNPFNANVTLKFEIPEPGIFRIELFDVLGRRARELWMGPVAYEEVIRFDGSALASGIYYARAWQTTHSRSVATAKLVLLK